MNKDQQIKVNMSKKGKLTSRLERTDRYSEQYQHRLSCRSELGYCLLSEMPKMKKGKIIVMPPQNQNYVILLVVSKAELQPLRRSPFQQRRH